MIAELVRLYFSTVHCKCPEYRVLSRLLTAWPDFGYLSFVHEADFWDRFDKGNPPVGLTLLMAANALRYVDR